MNQGVQRVWSQQELEEFDEFGVRQLISFRIR